MGPYIACFKEYSSLHIPSAEEGVVISAPKIHLKLKILMTLFDKIFINLIAILLYFFISITDQTIITAQTALHHCTFQVVTAHFAHHCMLKQALHGPITIFTHKPN